MFPLNFFLLTAIYWSRAVRLVPTVEDGLIPRRRAPVAFVLHFAGLDVK